MKGKLIPSVSLIFPIVHSGTETMPGQMGNESTSHRESFLGVHYAPLRTGTRRAFYGLKRVSICSNMKPMLMTIHHAPFGLRSAIHGTSP